jgi:Mg-chelatase subunit ChlD
MTSFSTSANLDVHLTNDPTALHTAINAMVSAGTTDLEDGILVGTGELANPGDGHDRDDNTSPDTMVIITDGAPNECNDPGSGCDPATAAADAADAARAAGIEVYVVGVGAGSSGALATYLQTEIADDASHFFAATNFADLQAILEELANCPEEEPDPQLVN